MDVLNIKAERIEYWCQKMLQKIGISEKDSATAVCNYAGGYFLSSMIFLTELN